MTKQRAPAGADPGETGAPPAAGTAVSALGRRTGLGARVLASTPAAWLAVAALLTVAANHVIARRPFDGESHSWVSAHFGTMARAFVERGVLPLRMIPIQNNPPLGNEPDAYTHWPPLFPILLSGAFRAFEESEAVARGVMLVIAAASCVALSALVRACAGPRAGLLAAFGVLVTPVFIASGNTVSHLPLATLFLTLAVLGFVRATEGERLGRGWATFGAAAMALAVLSSWEPLLGTAGLWLASFWVGSRNGRRLAFLYGAIGAMVAGAVVANSAQAYPFLFEDLWRTVMFRSGLGYASQNHVPVHTLVNLVTYGHEPSLPMVAARLVRRALALGEIPLVALVGVLIGAIVAERAGVSKLRLLLGGLLVPWLLWEVLMSHHAYYHGYEMLLAVPAAAATLGVGLSAAAAFFTRAKDPTLNAMRWVPLLAVPTVLLIAAGLAWQTAIQAGSARTGLLEYAREIQEATEPSAVVLTPEKSMVPVYYARRHLIRGIRDDRRVDESLQSMNGVFPGSPVYLALHPDRLTGFTRTLALYPVWKASTHVLLLALSGERAGFGS
ncbi:MAG: ArnT family glycosyltransferase [Gammaproteobacteria bacterium]